jgi:hypothetical protein
VQLNLFHVKHLCLGSAYFCFDVFHVKQKIPMRDIGILDPIKVFWIFANNFVDIEVVWGCSF